MPVKPYKKYKGRGKKYYYKYRDEYGKWVERAGTTSYAETDDIRKKKESQAKLIRLGVVDPRLMLAQDNANRPMTGLIQEFGSSLTSSPKSIRWTVRYIERCVEDCGFTCLRDFDASIVERWLKATFPGQRSYDAALKAVRHLINWAGRRSYMMFNPLKPIECKGEGLSSRPTRVIEPDEFGQLVGSCKPYRAFFYRIAAFTMMRWDEVSRLRWCDIDLNNRILTVRIGKTRDNETIPIYKRLVDEFHEQHPGRKDLADLVVTRQPRLATWKKDIKAAGLTYAGPDGSLHRKCLRTSSITWLLEAGVPIAHVAKIARHKSTEITLKHYAKLRLIDLNSAIDQLPIATNKRQENCLPMPIDTTHCQESESA